MMLAVKRKIISNFMQNIFPHCQNGKIIWVQNIILQNNEVNKKNCFIIALLIKKCFLVSKMCFCESEGTFFLV